MKSLLFVINTMGTGGGEHALLELLRQMDMRKYQVSLFVLTGQGELIGKIPPEVTILNQKYASVSVLDCAGKARLCRTVLKSLLTRAVVIRRAGYLARNLFRMLKKGEIQKDKLFWKILADGAPEPKQEYDLAVAYLEGGAAYYVASHVKARKKAAFLHIDHKAAGYTRELDEDCYLAFDRVFAVSESVKKAFLAVYPECRDRTEVFYNLIDRGRVLGRAKEQGGFPYEQKGFRILTVSRLVPQKAIHTAIEAMRLLKASGRSFCWYVLGEGELRRKLEEQICSFGLEKDFFLPGIAENPFPYYAQCDLYVHTSGFEGKSIAIEEAQILGCAILAVDHDGIREQIHDGVDGRLCRPDAKVLAEQILYLSDRPKLRQTYGRAASGRTQADHKKETEKLMKLLSDSES